MATTIRFTATGDGVTDTCTTVVLDEYNFISGVLTSFITNITGYTGTTVCWDNTTFVFQNGLFTGTP